MRLERLSADMVRFNQLYREAVTRQGGLFIDIWEPFLDDRNRFTLYGPDVNGQNVKLRLADGVHFTKAGARKAAHFASIDINRIIERKKNPSAAPVAKGTKLPSAGANNTSNAAGRADPARTIRTAVPTPDAPANVIFPVKPEAGPVVQLTAAPLTPNGELAGAIQKKSLARASPAQNRPPAVPGARTGRADDFSWPKKQSQ